MQNEHEPDGPFTAGDVPTDNARHERRQMQPTEATTTVEPHRDYHGYALGADLFHLGFRAEDAFTLMGIRSLSLPELNEQLKVAEYCNRGANVGQLLLALTHLNRENLEARGRQESWRRRKVQYDAQLQSWRERSASGASDDWRALHMTAGQRELIRETSILLRLDIPHPMTRGEAADWLDRHGANLSYRKEF